MQQDHKENRVRDLCIDWVFIKVPWILFWLLVAVLLWEVFSPRQLVGEVKRVNEKDDCYVLGFEMTQNSDHLLVDKRLYPLAETPDRLDTFLGWKLRAEGRVRQAEAGGRFIHVRNLNQLERLE